MGRALTLHSRDPCLRPSPLKLSTAPVTLPGALPPATQRLFFPLSHRPWPSRRPIQTKDPALRL